MPTSSASRWTGSSGTTRRADRSLSNCCSGICVGNEPEKGRKDHSHCLAHNQSTSQVEQQPSVCGGTEVECETLTGATGRCATTTGNGTFCAALLGCASCRQDTDCERFCGAGAAYIPCAGPCANQSGTICAGTGVTGCVFPDRT